jgi:hypothetical protein
VRSLPGNNASIIVTELIGDGSYQVKPEEEVVFHSGQLRLIDSKVPEDCGCPEPEPVNLAAAPPTPNAQPKTAPSTPVTAAVPANKPGEMQAEVDASMVFHGRPKAPAVPDAPTQEAENLPTGSHSADAIAATALPPPASAPVDSAAAKTSTHRSLLGRMASFFGRLFH